MSKKITTKRYVDQATGIRLSLHEKLCAERMTTLVKSIETLSKDVSDLKAHLNKGKGMISLLVFAAAVAATILGFLKIK